MKYCLDCVIKHIADAKINNDEMFNGYPDHALDVIGNLSQASIESAGISKELSNDIRQHRLLFMEDNSYEVPYYELYNEVKRIISESGCGDCKKAKEDFKEKIRKSKYEIELVSTLENLREGLVDAPNTNIIDYIDIALNK